MLSAENKQQPHWKEKQILRPQFPIQPVTGRQNEGGEGERACKENLSRVSSLSSPLAPHLWTERST